MRNKHRPAYYVEFAEQLPAKYTSVMVFTQVASLKKPLKSQIDMIRKKMKTFLPEIDGVGVLLVGSCGENRATYLSDIDLLVLLSGGALTYSRISRLRDLLDKTMGSQPQPLPIHANFVLPTVFETEEPAMQRALSTSVVLYAVTDIIQKQLQHLKRRGRL